MIMILCNFEFKFLSEAHNYILVSRGLSCNIKPLKEYAFIILDLPIDVLWIWIEFGKK